VSYDQSPARRGLDRLLAVMPHLDLIRLEWQGDGPWVLIDLGQRSEGEAEAWAIHRYAIFKRTGAVHGMSGGAVTDDPILMP
jgi:hypothetical protein